MKGGRPIEAARTLGRIARSRSLRRLQLAWASFLTAEAAYLVALAVLAYRMGGVATVGLVVLIQMLAGAAAAPVGAVIADRAPRERVLLAGDALCAIAVVALATVAATGGSRVAIFSLTAACAVAASPSRPAHWAITPLLARSPEELVAANVATSLVEGLAVLIGPALAGVLLLFVGPPIVLFACACGFALGAVLVRPIATDAAPSSAEHRLGDAFAGVRVAIDRGPARLLVALFGAQTFVRGMLTVLIVAAAVEVLAIGSSGVGFLTAGLGAGAFVGALAALALVGKVRLARPLVWGLLAWGAPIAVIGAWPDRWLALACLAVVGAGNSVFDVTGLTLVQRLVADRVLGRVLGVVESLGLAGIGFGASVAPLAIDLIGVRSTLVVTGALMPLLVLVASRSIAALDDASVVPLRELEVLRRLDLFAVLPAPALEQLARALFPIGFPAGRRIIRQGDRGDRFYVLTSGEVEVACDGRVVAALGAGDYFGEIALLEDVPRTATVTARTDVSVYALEGPDFVGAVSGSRNSSGAARRIIDARIRVGGAEAA